MSETPAEKPAETVVVTGANRGIGLEYARRFVERGATVVATARRPAQAGELAALGCEVLPLDVADDESVRRFGAALEGRPVDLLVGNAGVYGERQPLGRVETDTLLSVFRTNAAGPLAVAQALLPNLRAGRRKTIVHMTSRMGSIADNTSGGSYAYRASKAALNAFSKSLACDLAGEGFTCVVLHPGWVRTAMGGSSAPLSIEDSVTGLLAVIDRLTPRDNGRFFDYRGEELPW